MGHVVGTQDRRDAHGQLRCGRGAAVALWFLVTLGGAIGSGTAAGGATASAPAAAVTHQVPRSAGAARAHFSAGYPG